MSEFDLKADRNSVRTPDRTPGEQAIAYDELVTSSDRLTPTGLKLREIDPIEEGITEERELDIITEANKLTMEYLAAMENLKKPKG